MNLNKDNKIKVGTHCSHIMSEGSSDHLHLQEVPTSSVYVYLFWVQVHACDVYLHGIFAATADTQ